jgi:ABC-type glycerol-3-phosphate transport system permease component
MRAMRSLARGGFTMTCTSCGATLNPDVRFCTHCGAVVSATQVPNAQIPPTQATWQPQAAPVYAAAMPRLDNTRVSRHIQAAGILWIVYAVYHTGSKLLGLAVLHGIFGDHFHSGFGSNWGSMGDFGMNFIWPMAIFSILLSLALALLTGYALLTRQPWGRIIAIIASILALIHPVLGTVLGIYTLWVLAPAVSGLEYQQLTAATPR